MGRDITADLAPLDDQLAELDALGAAPAIRTAHKVWRAVWPKVAALALVVLVWQIVVLSGWRPRYVLPGPGEVFERLGHDLSGGSLPGAVGVTMRRAFLGYGLSVLIGATLGLAIARSRVLRAAFGSLIAGLQTMPSIAWFPLAILLFKLSEGAILFVVVLGAAPAIANGLLSGVDHIPPLLLRAGRVLGARGLDSYRFVILPAALPAFIGGLKQGWAFAWRSLMAGELLVIIANQPSIGARLQFAREFSDAPGLIAAMIVILVIGIIVDSLIFGSLTRVVRRRWGLVDAARPL